MRLSILLFVGFFVVAMSGCSDPYKQELPTDGRITPAMASKIVERLPPEDGRTFERWVRRSAAGERFGGEPGASNVRIAIFNQLEFEQKKKIELDELMAKEREKKAALDRIASEKIAAENAAKLLLEQRQRVALAIRTYFDVELVEYALEDVTTQMGSKIGEQWRFTLRLKNLMTGVSVVGFAGWLSLYDVFNEELGFVSFRLEPLVKPGSVVKFDAFMDFQPRNAQHVLMRATKRMRGDFFLESLALSDGTTIDRTSLERVSVKNSSVKSSVGGI